MWKWVIGMPWQVGIRRWTDAGRGGLQLRGGELVHRILTVVALHIHKSGPSRGIHNARNLCKGILCKGTSARSAMLLNT